MHPATREFLAGMPVASTLDPSALISLVQRSGMSRLNEWNASGRLDFTIANTHRLAMRYIQAGQSLDTIDPTTVAPRTMLAHASPSNAMASWTSLLGSVFNEMKVGLNRAPTGLAYATPLSWMNAVGAMPGAQVPTWIFGGVGRLAGGEFGRSSDYRSRSYSVLDTLSWTRDRHTIKTGFETRSVRVPLSVLGGTLYSFGIEGFLADMGATVSYMGDVHAEARQNLYSAFMQDEWRIRPNFTINAGLRYEYYRPVSEASGKARVFDMSRLDYLAPGSPMYKAGKLGLAPRLGLVWAPSALNSRTIFRVGSAIHYSPGALRDFLGPIQSSAERWTADGMSFPADFSDPAVAAGIAQDPLGVNTDSSFRQRVYQWGFSVQQILPSRFTAQAGYIGSAGRDLLTRRWGNFVTGLGPAGAIRQKPGFGEIAYIDGGGSSNYHALQLQLNRRFTDDFVVGAQYSWSHNITDTPSENASLQDPRCLRCEKGPADFDMRHSASLNAYYRVPLGRGARHLSSGALGYVLADWSAGAILNIRSGMPVNIDLERQDIAVVDAAGHIADPTAEGTHFVLDTPLGGERRGSLRPDVIAGVDPYLHNRLFPFNPAAFSVPAFGQYGNLGHNALMGPGFSQLDFQLTRAFRLGEGKELRFRADVYNVANHPNFASPLKLLVNSAPVQEPGTAFGADQLQNFGFVGSTVGRDLGLGTPREIQFGLRLSF